MAELSLDVHERVTFSGELTDAGMTQAVSVDALLNSGFLGTPRKHFADLRSANRSSLERAEERPVSREADFLTAFEPRGQHVGRLVVDDGDARFPSFAFEDAF